MSGEFPLISFLVPLYNHEKYIVQCLQSIIDDDYPNKELIVIDDGSPDSSADVVRRWLPAGRDAFPGRLEFVSRENRGVSATLNELLERSRGDFIAFVSSDDYLLPGGTMARLDYLRAHPEKMLVLADYVVVDDKGELIHTSGVEGLFRGRKKCLLDERWVNHELVFHWCMGGPVYLGRRELYRIHGGYDEELGVEDWDFCLRLAAKNLIGFVDYKVAAYRVHPKPYEYDTPRAIRYNSSMLMTVEKHFRAFYGLPHLYLRADAMIYRGKIARYTGKGRLVGLLQRRAGSFLRSLSKRLYDWRVKITACLESDCP